MDPGRLSQRIKIIDPYATAINELGELTATPKLVAECWANVQDKGGRDFIESQKIMPESRYIVKIRYRDDISEDNEIEWRNKTLIITNVFDVASRLEYLEIQCYQKGAQRK